MAQRYQNPTGTRDFYPDDLLRKRYIERIWRDTAVRHGFDEIEGPTFEHLDLYTVKSGEGIVSELFSFRRAGGERDFALRPEFTPTLARMYAARAGSLPRPVRWFSIGPYFRAERPQRGRLREFLQWNADIVADDRADGSGARPADAECLACCLDALTLAGLGADAVSARINERTAVAGILSACGIPEDRHADCFAHLDQAGRAPPDQWAARARDLGIPDALVRWFRTGGDSEQTDGLDPQIRNAIDRWQRSLAAVREHLIATGVPAGMVQPDVRIVRGLAYYTGLVFEVAAEGERAVCGGGRYDNLIELFNGPPTPAVGFGMGDVVLSLVLQDRGLMPDRQALLDVLSRAPAPLRPDAFVLAPDPSREPLVDPLVCALRRGRESDAWKERSGAPWDADRFAVPPLHARRSYRSTRNLGKLLKDAAGQGARFAVIVEDDRRVTLKDLRTQEQSSVPAEDLGTHIAAGITR